MFCSVTVIILQLSKGQIWIICFLPYHDHNPNISTLKFDFCSTGFYYKQLYTTRFFTVLNLQPIFLDLADIVKAREYQAYISICDRIFIPQPTNLHRKIGQDICSIISRNLLRYLQHHKPKSSRP